MTEQTPGTGITFESNAASAPVEQQSTETVVEQPKTRHEQRRAEMSLPSTETPVEAKPAEPVKPAEPTEADKANQAARQALQDRMRAEDAERRLKEMTPKAEVPDKCPDINDQKTWGKKYQDATNDLDTFLKARDEWVEAQSEKKFAERQQQAEAAKALGKQRIDVATRDQAARGKYKDYDAVINPVIPILASSPILKDFVTKNPMGSEVAYELGKNPAVLQTLLQTAQTDIWAAGEQLISMAARLKAPKPVEITKAPEPITPVGSRETVKTNILQLASKDNGAYIAEMNKRDLNRLRRH
jgi:hypothetical protein